MEKDGSKRLSSVDLEEEIEVKPSTELTADEYRRIDNEKMLVHIFSSPYNEHVQEFQDLLEDIGYKNINKHDLEFAKNREKRNAILNKISKEGAEGKDGFILLFANASLTTTDLTEIWSLFTARNCPALKKKPKIFIFEEKDRDAKDSGSKDSLEYGYGYDIPSEADIMILYEHRSADDATRLIRQLTENIEDYGEREDINTLATYDREEDATSEIKKPPRHMLISTMRKKFYFVPANQRGHHHAITKWYTTINETLKNIKTAAEEHKNGNEPKNGKKSSRGPSFRNKKTPDVSPKVHRSIHADLEELKGTDSTKIIKGKRSESAHKSAKVVENTKIQVPSTSKFVKGDINRKMSTANEVSSSKKSVVSRTNKASEISSDKESVASRKNKTSDTRPIWKY